MSVAPSLPTVPPPRPHPSSASCPALLTLDAVPWRPRSPALPCARCYQRHMATPCNISWPCGAIRQLLVRVLWLRVPGTSCYSTEPCTAQSQTGDDGSPAALHAVGNTVLPRRCMLSATRFSRGGSVSTGSPAAAAITMVLQR